MVVLKRAGVALKRTVYWLTEILLVALAICPSLRLQFLLPKQPFPRFHWEYFEIPLESPTMLDVSTAELAPYLEVFSVSRRSVPKRAIHNPRLILGYNFHFWRACWYIYREVAKRVWGHQEWQRHEHFFTPTELSRLRLNGHGRSPTPTVLSLLQGKTKILTNPLLYT